MFENNKNNKKGALDADVSQVPVICGVRMEEPIKNIYISKNINEKKEKYTTWWPT